MDSKINIAKRFHAAIKTQHVFTKEEHVSLKRETQKAFSEDTDVAEWFPTNLKQGPIRL